MKQNRMVAAGALLLAAGLGLGACASSTKVGAGVHVGKTHGNANLTLPGQSNSPSPGATTAGAPKGTAATTTAPPATQAVASPTTTEHAATATTAAKPFAIGIYGDVNSQNKPAFDPPDAAVYVGTPVVFTNYDTTARSVVAEGGAFKSPLIAPGASWTWVPRVAGTYNYQDGTRPYANGTIQVYA